MQTFVQMCNMVYLREGVALFLFVCFVALMFNLSFTYTKQTVCRLPDTPSPFECFEIHIIDQVPKIYQDPKNGFGACDFLHVSAEFSLPVHCERDKGEEGSCEPVWLPMTKSQQQKCCDQRH